MQFKKEIRDQLAEQKASNFEEFGIVPNVADAGRPGTGYYDKAGKFVVYGPHHLGAGYVGPAGPAGYHHGFDGRDRGAKGGYPHGGYGGYGGYHGGQFGHHGYGHGGYGGHGYGHGMPGHPGHWGGAHPGYGGFGYPGGHHPGFLPGDHEAAAYGRKYAVSPVRLYGSPSAASRKARR